MRFLQAWRGWPVTRRVWAGWRPLCHTAAGLLLRDCDIKAAPERDCSGGLGQLCLKDRPSWAGNPRGRELGATRSLPPLGANSSALACTEIPKSRRSRAASSDTRAALRCPGPRSGHSVSALAGYQRHLLKQKHALQTHSRPDTSRLYIETGFARLTPAVLIKAPPVHTALIREASARPAPPPPPSHNSRFVPAESASLSQPRNVLGCECRMQK